MSQPTVETERGHHTNATESGEGAEKLAAAYSSGMLYGKNGKFYSKRLCALANEYRGANGP